MGQAILTEIISLLTGGITGIATGIGTGLQSLVQNIFIDNSGTAPTLSAFGVVTVVFAGVALAIGLCRGVVAMLESLGRKRV